jgi:cytochrome c-type biogenesis protein
MTTGFAEVWLLSFLAGLYTPLGSVCVLPLYPGFLAFLAGHVHDRPHASTLPFGIAVTCGVMGGMLIIGLLFIYILQLSAGGVISVIGPIVYTALVLISIAMILGLDISRIFPAVSTPRGKNPYFTAFLFGAFFGLVALPCNPGSIVMLFALSASTADFTANFINFIFFGIGMAIPLLALSLLSMERNRSIIGFFTRHHLTINRIAGVLMLAIALYYLVFVFLKEMM